MAFEDSLRMIIRETSMLATDIQLMNGLGECPELNAVSGFDLNATAFVLLGCHDCVQSQTHETTIEPSARDRIRTG